MTCDCPAPAHQHDAETEAKVEKLMEIVNATACALDRLTEALAMAVGVEPDDDQLANILHDIDCPRCAAHELLAAYPPAISRRPQ
jgi:ferritin-like protein